MRLTEQQIQSLKPESGRYEVWETNRKGFGLRVSPAGRKSFIFLYRFQGRSRRMTFGVYPKKSLAAALSDHSQALQLLGRGVDPAIVSQREKARSRHSLTVGQLAEDYISEYAQRRKRSWKEDCRILLKDVVPRWDKRKAQKITRGEIILLLDEIVDRGAPIQANRTLAAIRKMYTFGMARGILDSSPCVAVPAPAGENQRDRVLSAAEIHRFWHRLETAKIKKTTALALKLQLLTAQMKVEVATAKWADFDLKNGWWVIPAEHTRSRRPHRVPLSPLALVLLEELREMGSGSRWLFPSPSGDRHITETSMDCAVRNSLKHFGIDHFTPRDLRRTAVSLMTAVNVELSAVAKVLNQAVSNTPSDDEEKRKALTLLGNCLELIINGDPIFEI